MQTVSLLVSDIIIMINKSNEVYINHCGIETTDIGCEICDDVLYCYETTLHGRL